MFKLNILPKPPYPIPPYTAGDTINIDIANRLYNYYSILEIIIKSALKQLDTYNFFLIRIIII